MFYSNEEILERFAPQFDEVQTTRFQALINRIEQAFPHYRSQVVQAELDALAKNNNSLPDVRYEAALSTILDLTNRGGNCWYVIIISS